VRRSAIACLVDCDLKGLQEAVTPLYFWVTSLIGHKTEVVHYIRMSLIRSISLPELRFFGALVNAMASKTVGTERGNIQVGGPIDQ